MTDPRPGDGTRVYFPELDGLRFVAFGLVYLFHRGVPQLAPAINAGAALLGFERRMAPTGPGPGPGDTVVSNGWIGVQFFFLLSGFLITTLLLREESRFGRIDLRAFWMRRILRIWPLYYLIVLLTFLVLPALDGRLGQLEVRNLWRLHLGPFLLFAGNWSMGLLGPVPSDTISILWSVCVEEQFYLVCPLLIAWVAPSRRIPCVVGLMGLAIAGRFLTATRLEAGQVTPLFFQYSTLTQLDTLLSGVLLALLMRNSIDSRPAGVGSLLRFVVACAAVAVLFRPGLGNGSALNRTLVFVAIWLVGMGLVSVAIAGRGMLPAILRYSRLVWLGRISYGLYMYHEIAFWTQRRMFDAIGWFPNRDALAPFLAFALTVGFAAASYYGFERPFLKRKSGWSRIASRPV